MVNIRRTYVFLVCLFSLQPATWAAIELTRSLITYRQRVSIEATAFEIAVSLIGWAIFLVHWVWAQRTAAREREERESILRRAYIYITLTAFLAPFLANLYDVFKWMFSLFTGQRPGSLNIAPTEAILSDVVTLIVLAVMWFYHHRVLAEDVQVAPETGNAGAVRRIYLFGFSAAGLTMVSSGAINLLQWMLFQFGDGAAIRQGVSFVTDQIALLIAGVPVWIIFWTRVQRMFASGDSEERDSVVRKIYLYLVVFITVLTFVTTSAMLLAGIFRRALGLAVSEDWRAIAPTILVSGVVWAYHAFVLHGDESVVTQAPRQAMIRRLYLYLVAGIGLAAFLIGLGGDVNVLIRTLASGFTGNDIKEQLSWFTAALIAGVLVWILPWRRAQLAAVAVSGADERRSLIRKIYLFFYLFVATMTVLACAVYVVFRPLSVILGARFEGNVITDIAQAIAYALIGVAVWVYHGWALRGDGALHRREHAERLADLRVAILRSDDARWSDAVIASLQREYPGLAIECLEPANAMRSIAHAGLIVATSSNLLDAKIASALNASVARKLIVPLRSETWEWLNADDDASIARAIKQIVEGEPVKANRFSFAGMIAALVAICVLIQLVQVLFRLFMGLGM
jgi:hypothetical protein